MKKKIQSGVIDFNSTNTPIFNPYSVDFPFFILFIFFNV